MCDTRDDTTTRSGREACRETTPAATDGGDAPGGWLGDADVLEARLPAALRSSLGRFVGRESVDTLGEWATHVRHLTGGGSIAVEQLCHADGETDHWGVADGERYHFRCFYDAVVLAALEDRPVDVRTVSPCGEAVEAHAAGSEALSVAPETAVFSFGIEPDVRAQSGSGPTLEDAYVAICPYVKAFPDRDAYEQWADEVTAATVALPLAGATELATALVA